MVRVMATGVFDILHPGHLYFLSEARKLGDELIVVVARDSTVRKTKHEPITPENMRLKLIEALKPVDRAVLGYEDDFYRVVVELKPDIIVLGYDQLHDPEKIGKDLEKRGFKNMKIVRLPRFEDDLNGTRKIIRKVMDMWSFDKYIKGVEGDKTLKSDKDKLPQKK